MDRKRVVFYALLAGGVLMFVGIVAANLFLEAEVPKGAGWETPPALRICDTAPAWAGPDSPDLDRALAFWRDHGVLIAGAVERGPCPPGCTGVDEKGRERVVSCVPGKLVIDLTDAVEAGNEDHVAACIRPSPLSWGTILVPSTILLDSDELPPADVQAIVLAHELGHCLADRDHVLGPRLLPGLRLNPKTGHVLNPSILKSGWGDEGLQP